MTPSVSLAFRPVRLSAMHRAHLAHGAALTDDGEWRVPDRFTSVEDEVRRALTGVGLADASAGTRLHVRGAAVEGVLLKAAGLERLAPGAAAWTRLNGAAALACRMAPDELLILASAGEGAAVADLVAKVAAGLGCCHVTDLTAGLAAMDLVGPATPRLLAKLVPLDLDALPVLGVVQGELAHARATLIRLDGGRVVAYRALVAREHGAFVWEALCHAGQDLGLVLVGAAARALLHSP